MSEKKSQEKLLDVKMCKWVGPTTLHVEFNPETFTGYEIVAAHFFAACNNYDALKAPNNAITDSVACPVCRVRSQSDFEQKQINCIDTLRRLRNICAKIESRRLVGAPIDEASWDEMRKETIEATIHLKRVDGELR